MIGRRLISSGTVVLLGASAILLQLCLFTPFVTFVDELLLFSCNVSMAREIRRQLNEVKDCGSSGNSSVERFIDGTSDSLDGVDYTHVSR